MRSQPAPIAPTPGLRFALAYLANDAGEDRWAFDNFWKAVTSNQDGASRRQRASASLNTIYRLTGARRVVFQDKSEFVLGSHADIPRESWGARQTRLAAEK